MLKPFALSLSLAFASQAAALDLNALSDAERDAFRDEVRSYLLDNPEVLMEAIGVLEQRQAELEAASDEQLLAENAAALYDDGFSFVGGNPDGDITIVEFMDYRCGYCKRAFSEVEQLLSADGNIRFVVKEYPILGEQSVLASRFAIAVKQLYGDESYKLVHDTLMELRTDVSAGSLTRLAQTLGLNEASILDHMQSDDVAAVLEETSRLGQRMKVSGTPTFVIGDELVRGYVSLDSMEQIVKAVRDAS